MFQLPEKLPLTFTNSKGHFRKLLSPNDDGFLTSVQDATPEDIEFLLQETGRAHMEMQKLRPYERSAILKKVAAILKSKEEFLSQVIAAEGGKHTHCGAQRPEQRAGVAL